MSKACELFIFLTGLTRGTLQTLFFKLHPLTVSLITHVNKLAKIPLFKSKVCVLQVLYMFSQRNKLVIQIFES